MVIPSYRALQGEILTGNYCEIRVWVELGLIAGEITMKKLILLEKVLKYICNLHVSSIFTQFNLQIRLQRLQQASFSL